MTDNEIVKCAEVCVSAIPRCDICPYDDVSDVVGECENALLKDLVAVINRLQAENERLLQKLQQAQKQKDKFMDAQMFLAKTSDEQQVEIERLQDAIDEQDIEIASLWKRIEDAKAEAYKECIEKVKEKSCKLNMCHNDVVVKTDYQISSENLDNLLKEMERADNV